VVRAARIFVRRSRPVAGLRVDDFSPKHGWPGTIISITGHGFSPVRDSNAVYIGAERALVVEADPNRLLVVTPMTTVTAPLKVTVGGSTATSETFTVLPIPDPADPTLSGPPRFLAGPHVGTPATNVQNQPVLMSLAYPADHDPGTPARRAVGTAVRVVVRPHELQSSPVRRGVVHSFC